MLNLLLLNKAINRQIFKSEFCQKASIKILKLHNEQANQQNCFQILQDKTGISCNSFQDLYRCLSGSFNMIKNPIGQKGFNHWKKQDRGDGWAVQRFLTYKNNPTVFVSSYGWCDLQQTIEFVTYQPSILVVGSPVARRNDCGSQARLTVQINGQKSVTQIVCPTSQYVPLQLKFDIIPDKKYIVECTFSGKDTRFWAGWYGARFGYPSARLYKLPLG